MSEDFLKPYDHSKEKEIYDAWEKSGFFAPQENTGSHENFSIIMPPPNANGSLHVGHAVMVAVEDLLIRYWRMRGKKVLWLPGADHAGFETQVVFEKRLEKEGTSRFEILQKENGRQELYDRILEFTLANKFHMERQIRQLGASCDWNKETFTLDPKIIDIVYETFKKLFDDGLVYRAERIVNWCVKHQTSLSDLEVDWEERDDYIYYINYVFWDNPNKHITIATTRPETIPGDVMIAVHPTDERYKEFIGKFVKNPLTNERLPIYENDIVDKSFGTGALKVTPAHDATDFEIGRSVGMKKTMSFNGRFNELAGPLSGLKVMEARKKAIEILKEKKLIEKIEPYKHQVGVCYKCRNTVEPMVLEQWFVDLTRKGKEKMVQPAIDAVKSGKIKIIPEFQEKIFLHWMENIRDWNISRQIVWGIPIPAGLCAHCGWVVLSNLKDKQSTCPKCGSAISVKDTDVFDTWFSSGQWPFATLRAHGLEQEFYPTSVMETAYDILFFWVARMIMLGIYQTGKVPFETVYLHGLVRDKDKQKMSKSKGNVVDPLGIVEQYGADALRMALIVGNSPGQDVTFAEQKIKGYRNFSNKLWNIARFVLSQTEKIKNESKKQSILLEKEKKQLEEAKKVKNEIGENIEKYRFSQAAEIAYHYVWHEFADIIIEEKKKILQNERAHTEEKESAITLLYALLMESLKMLHPFMPFVTEAIYQRLPKKNKEFLMIENWE